MRVFLDMDGVLADLDRLIRDEGVHPDILVKRPDTFLNLHPVEGAKEAVPQIMAMGFDVFIATKPSPSHPHTYHDKARWVLQHFPELRRRLIMTQDKGLLGAEQDVLIDDRPGKANCLAFPGRLIQFGCNPENPVMIDVPYHATDWPEALEILRGLRPH